MAGVADVLALGTAAAVVYGTGVQRHRGSAGVQRHLAGDHLAGDLAGGVFATHAVVGRVEADGRVGGVEDGPRVHEEVGDPPPCCREEGRLGAGAIWVARRMGGEAAGSPTCLLYTSPSPRDA